MRYYIAMMGGLLGEPAHGQVAAMGGMANPSVAGANMNAGADIANMGGNANFGTVRPELGGGYGATTGASVIGSNLAGVGGRPVAAADARYFGQNSGTIAGMYGTGAAVANQPGQPFGQNRYRSMFTNGGVTNYNPGVQSRFGGANNGQGYTGQSFAQANSRGYNQAGYSSAVPSPIQGGWATITSTFQGCMTTTAPTINGMPAYTYGHYSPGVWPGYAPYRAYRSSPQPMYPSPNVLAPGTY